MTVDKKYRPYEYRFRNKTLDWLPADTEERYLEHYKNNYSELEKNGWIDNHFTYKFNSYGFRCEEFSDEPTLMALGCSNTIGIGLPVDKIWPELLAKELNLKCANLATGGGSLDSQFRMCCGYIDIIKPKIVVLLQPPPERLEVYFDNPDGDPTRVGHWTLDTPDVDGNIREFIRQWFANENNSHFNKEKNILAIKQMCAERNIKFVYKDDGTLRNSCNPPTLARDLMHAGIDHHVKFTKELLLNI